MGRVKTGLVKRTSRNLLAESSDSFTKDFDKNKKILGNTMPSRRLRNMIAGYITRAKRNTKKIISEEPSDLLDAN